MESQETVYEREQKKRVETRVEWSLRESLAWFGDDRLGNNAAPARTITGVGWTRWHPELLQLRGLRSLHLSDVSLDSKSLIGLRQLPELRKLSLRQVESGPLSDEVFDLPERQFPQLG